MALDAAKQLQHTRECLKGAPHLTGHPRDRATPLGYHVISGEVLLAQLHRCANGEDPDLVYAEAWANAEHEDVP